MEAYNWSRRFSSLSSQGSTTAAFCLTVPNRSSMHRHRDQVGCYTCRARAFPKQNRRERERERERERAWEGRTCWLPLAAAAAGGLRSGAGRRVVVKIGEDGEGGGLRLLQDGQGEQARGVGAIALLRAVVKHGKVQLGRPQRRASALLLQRHRRALLVLVDREPAGRRPTIVGRCAWWWWWVVG